MTSILVYGYYNKQNFGDELFEYAFKKLFPEYNFIFTDYIKKQDLDKVDAVIIGGGSFLNEYLKIEENCIDILKNKKILFIGIGCETNIHELYIDLLKIAKLIAVRNDNIKNIINLNSNIIRIKDLAYCLEFKPACITSNKVLVLPNLYLVPSNNEPAWKDISWNYFKSEMSQFLDYLIENNYCVNFLGLSYNESFKDDWAAIEIMNKMKYKNNNMILKNNSLFSKFSDYNYIISQRYHGRIIADILGIKNITISHHNKLNFDDSISYYGISKDILIKKFHTLEKKYPKIVSFEQLIINVNDIINCR